MSHFTSISCYHKKVKSGLENRKEQGRKEVFMMKTLESKKKLKEVNRGSELHSDVCLGERELSCTNL